MVERSAIEVSSGTEKSYYKLWYQISNIKLNIDKLYPHSLQHSSDTSTGASRKPHCGRVQTMRQCRQRAIAWQPEPAIRRRVWSEWFSSIRLFNVQSLIILKNFSERNAAWPAKNTQRVAMARRTAWQTLTRFCTRWAHQWRQSSKTHILHYYTWAQK